MGDQVDQGETTAHGTKRDRIPRTRERALRSDAKASRKTLLAAARELFAEVLADTAAAPLATLAPPLRRRRSMPLSLIWAISAKSRRMLPSRTMM